MLSMLGKPDYHCISTGKRSDVYCKVCPSLSMKSTLFAPGNKHAMSPRYSFILFWDSTTVEMIMVMRARAIQSQPRSVTWNFSPSTM